VGDQLHPWGVLDKRSYSLIGQVYEAVETKEPWCVDASPVLEIGLVHPDGFDISAGHGLNPAAVGAVRMLQELSWQFDVIDGDADFTKYRVIVVPDAAALDDQAIGRLQKFCEKGGKVLSSAWALIDRNTGLHALENRIHVTGDAEYEPDFIVAPFVSGMGNDEHVMYFRGVRIEPDDGLEVLAWVNKPAFNRTWKHYCSHRHAPSLGERVYPGIVTGPSIIHCMHPVFTTYTQMDVSWYKALVDACLKRFIINPVVRHDGPSSLVVLVNRQVEERRYVVHMLHYIPERRGQQFDVVHDVIPLHDITLVLNLPVTPARARLVPDGLDLNVRAGQDGSVSLTVPEFSGHCMMELLYEELA